ncbi:cytochrome P460 [Rhodanobacter sp. B04]|uniref:cytochrome P460 family protein n=1 Tax=Rhodanobacter sp. B04 TaxID=1945860 RepID=UPI0009845DED|nr:cytochrome P460 family protein [Rhodanobacter sp. B04]OOG64418.1 cytochrome P460 [Rhodanobacter sp. B04]
MSRPVLFRLALVVAAVAALPIGSFADGQTKNAHEPVYTSDGRIIPPKDYREWVFLSSGLDMSYNKKAIASDKPVFDNVFVNPEAYRVFRQTGTWPDKTQFVLEVRSSSSKGSINQRGHFQSTDVLGFEMHVKDMARFDRGWAFFDVDGNAPAAKIPTTATCYACHGEHAAVDTTFVQFYPTLLPIAQKQATLSASYLKDEAELAKTVH